jgi:phosphatidylinositol kinase/protein kinase (PI-3  family)
LKSEFDEEVEESTQKNAVNISAEEEGERAVINKKALSITNRILNKLTGKDFHTPEPLNVTEQVEKLIKHATDIENLAQCYIGWSPYW